MESSQLSISLIHKMQITASNKIFADSYQLNLNQAPLDIMYIISFDGVVDRWQDAATYEKGTWPSPCPSLVGVRPSPMDLCISSFIPFLVPALLRCNNEATLLQPQSFFLPIWDLVLALPESFNTSFYHKFSDDCTSLMFFLIHKFKFSFIIIYQGNHISLQKIRGKIDNIPTHWA